MKMTEFAKSIGNLPKKEKLAILEIIDLKVDSDMDRVLDRLDTINSRIDRLDSSLKWSIGIGFTLLGILITILNFLE
ncbi:hypothetical protein [Sediminicola luteus]|uniref:Uncharacterized protein n=1 Tax=Sediminicola luteus TaxID=319238 RepID=A0A2A4GCG9_9FLAO|nr:hypothetical protein [Sediminicola luteus]PCE66649.1 hypothetical protein B7P33_04970 [Sediminicola luteus]